MPKITELNQITSVSNNDLLVVAHDPSGLPITNSITVNNFARYITTNLSAASGPQGAIPVNTGSNTFTWELNPDSRANILITSDYTALANDSIILADPSVNRSSINVFLPHSPPNGKIYAVENRFNSGGGAYIVQVRADDGSTIIEDPVTGNLLSTVQLVYTSEGYSWIFQNGYYRVLSSQHNVRVFYESANTYSQVAIQNISQGDVASGDFVVYNDQGNYAQGTGPFIDMGIDSSTYSSNLYGSIFQSNDGYLYNSGGDLLLGTQTDNAVKLFAGNTNLENVALSLNSSSIFVYNSIYSGNTTDELAIFASNGQGVSIYSNNYAEFGITSDGQGGGPDQVYVFGEVDNSGHTNSLFAVFVSNSSTSSEWNYYANGSISFPDGSYQHTAFNGHTLTNNNYSFDLGSNGTVITGAILSFDERVTGIPNHTGNTDIVRLYDFFETNPSGYNYALGVEGGHIWHTVDIQDDTGGFKFYSQNNVVTKIGAGGTLFQYGNVVPAVTGGTLGTPTFPWYSTYSQYIFGTSASLVQVGSPTNLTLQAGAMNFVFATNGDFIAPGALMVNNSIGTAGQVMTSNGSGAYWSTTVGYAGSRGVTGYTGSFGSTGYTGSFGNTGYTGSFGSTGYTGSQGVVGYTGSFGSTGYTGSQGSFSGTFTQNINASNYNLANVNLLSANVIVANASVGSATSYATSVGYIGIPQNSQSTNYQLQFSDAGGHVYVSSNAIVTIANNTTVAFPVGTTITFVAGPNVYANIAITTDTMYLAGSGNTGTRFLAPYGMATALKTTSTTWFINGSGLS